jgi:hypothetical protein
VNLSEAVTEPAVARTGKWLIIFIVWFQKMLHRIQWVTPDFHDWFLLHDNAPVHTTLTLHKDFFWRGKRSVTEFNSLPLTYSLHLALDDSYLVPKL